MRKVYFVKRGDLVIFVSSNLKACHDCLCHHRLELDVRYFHTYMHVTRHMKGQNFYYVPSHSGPKWEILSFDLAPKFIPTV